MKYTKKYKQTEIPSVSILRKDDLSQYIKQYYKENLQGKTVLNKDLNVMISFTSFGQGKVAYGGRKTARKAAVIQCLDKLVEFAQYNNFGIRKPTDPQSVLGYLNFKAKVKIDGVVEHVRITALIKKSGRLYYNHEINFIK
ncbi:MAG: hypothetical protein FWG79_03785 [Bacteroidales bacterium]|nr:hypothetical protein [Bacteroidales bacterium]